jgi:hypothetical protein
VECVDKEDEDEDEVELRWIGAPPSRVVCVGTPTPRTSIAGLTSEAGAV